MRKYSVVITIAVLLLLLIAIMPVNGWTLVDTVISNSGPQNNLHFDPGTLRFHNYTVSKGITKLEYSGTAIFPSGSRVSGTFTGGLYRTELPPNPTKFGDVTITWAGTPFTNWSNYGPVTVTETFSNMNQEITGPQSFQVFDDTGATSAYSYILDSCGFDITSYGNTSIVAPDFTGLSHTDASVIFTSNSVDYVLTGTWQSFTGSISPVASFTALPDNGYPPLSVNFTDTSTGPINAWTWGFGDSYTSNHPLNATHTYLMNGTYNASLTVSTGSETSTAYKNITVGLAPAIPGSFNLTVHIKDKSGVNLNNAHISLLPSTGPVLTNRTNSAGMAYFIAVPGSSAAIIDVTMTGYPEYIEAFTIASDMTKEITLGPTGIKFYADVKDSIYGSYISDITFSVKNTTSGVWRNTTSSSGAKYVDSTGASYEYPLSIGQTVIVAASKPGYLPDWKSITLTQGDPPQLVTLLLVNINGSAPSSGNFTAVIAAASMITGLEIPGASITINELGRMQATNGAGVAMFYNVPVGGYSLLVGATGYQSVTSDITGTDLETVMKRVDLLPNGFHQGENGTITDPDGNPYQPWNPNYGDGHGGYVPGGGAGNATASAANEKAANVITIFLDNAVSIGYFVFILLMFWFVKKIIWS